MSVENSVVAIYHTHTDADRAVKELERGGVDMKKLSIVGKGYHTDEQVVGYYKTGDRMKYWGKVGAFWGGFWGLLFGSALFIDPRPRPNLWQGFRTSQCCSAEAVAARSTPPEVQRLIAKPDPQGCGYSCLVCGGQR